MREWTVQRNRGTPSTGIKTKGVLYVKGVLIVVIITAKGTSSSSELGQERAYPTRAHGRTNRNKGDET